jgi:hypothetical protein
MKNTDLIPPSPTRRRSSLLWSLLPIALSVICLCSSLYFNAQRDHAMKAVGRATQAATQSGHSPDLTVAGLPNPDDYQRRVYWSWIAALVVLVFTVVRAVTQRHPFDWLVLSIVFVLALLSAPCL